MATLLEKITELNDLVLQGRMMEAFERFYHEEVVMQENENPPTAGKAANRIREEEFLNSIEEFRSAKPVRVTIGEGVTMVQWHYDYTHRQWGTRNYQQVSVQEWQDGKIVREQFFYGN